MASKAEQAEEYGYVQSLFNAVPELKKLFSKAVSGKWTADKFQAELRSTKWWKSHGSTERDYLILQYGDPATAKLKVAQAKTHVMQLMESIGLDTKSGAKEINSAVYNMVARGWTDDDLRNYLGKYIVFKNSASSGKSSYAGGAFGDAVDQLQQYTYNMGIKGTDKFYQDWGRLIARGLSTVNDAQDYVRKLVEAKYPEWKKELEGGQTMMDLASPYMQSMSQILEVPSGSLNLFDPTIQKAMQHKDPKTGKIAVQPIWDFENTLRKDPRWKKTKNAQDSAMQTAHQVLSDFGLTY